MGSTYVPIESWVYPAFERLEAFGYIQSLAFSGQRPWTRMECARLLEETADLDTDDLLEGEPARIYASLTKEFSEKSRRWMAPQTTVSVLIRSIYGAPPSLELQ